MPLSTDELLEQLSELKGAIDDVAECATADDMLLSATRLTSAMDPTQLQAAATLYVLRLLRERHRGKVLTVERSAARRSRKPYESTIPADDPYWERKAEREVQFWSTLRGYVDRYTDELKMEWTEELLSSTFALADGSLVSWGSATVDQHEARRDLLLANASGNLSSAARHEAALRLLAERHAQCLDDAMAIAA